MTRIYTLTKFFHILANILYCFSFPFEPFLGLAYSTILLRCILHWHAYRPEKRGFGLFSQLANHGVCHIGMRHCEQGEIADREDLPTSNCHMRPHALWACKAYETFFLILTIWVDVLQSSTYVLNHQLQFT